jgi:tetratricopeptide (TPR) repeat protein
MTDDLYERYKEALRIGHVAALRGSLEEALTAYRAAAGIAPSRALPHTSLGGALLRLGRLEPALVEFAAAVALAPHDEGALLGQAEALTVAGQRAEAARVLDHVSEIEEASGRLPEAADTLRRALELEESPDRARRQRGLRRETRLSAGDQAAEHLLARALRIRDEPTPRPNEPTGPDAAAAFGDQPGALPARWQGGGGRPVTHVDGPAWTSPGHDSAGPALSVPETAPAARSGSEDEAAPPAADFAFYASQAQSTELGHQPGYVTAARPAGTDGSDMAATAASDHKLASITHGPAATTPGAGEPVAVVVLPSGPFAVTPEPDIAVVGVMEGAIGTVALPGPVGESQHQPTGDELLIAAEAADAAGDGKALRSLLVWTARAYAREGRFDAGLDATHRLLQRSPGDVDAHLVLVELYVARHWDALAAEKLALLGRLADLDDDSETRARVCAVASRAFPNDARLGSICTAQN